MKILILYNTVDGNTAAVAKSIADKVGADVSQIVRVNKRYGYGFFNMLKSRLEVMFKRRPGIFPFKHDPRDYDLIFIGTPVWYDSYNPVFNTLFEVIKIYDRKIAIFSTGETEKEKALDKLAEKLHESVLLGRFHCVEPIWEDDEAVTEKILADAAEWAQGIADEAERMIEQEEFERRKTIYKF